jgi:glycosyltransferase involved in cell wall biosynthesis
MPVISIIVPVYKVEKYLRKCLDSILAQTFTDFECILVDLSFCRGSFLTKGR